MNNANDYTWRLETESQLLTTQHLYTRSSPSSAFIPVQSSILSNKWIFIIRIAVAVETSGRFSFHFLPSFSFSLCLFLSHIFYIEKRRCIRNEDDNVVVCCEQKLERLEKKNYYWVLTCSPHSAQRLWMKKLKKEPSLCGQCNCSYNCKIQM